MADVKFRVGRVKLSTAGAGNTQDFTIPGFGTPKAAMFFLSGAPFDNSIQPNSGISIGWCDGTSQGVVASAALDGEPVASNSARLVSATECILRANETILNDGALSFNSFGVDKVTLNIVKQVPVGHADYCTFVLIGGADVTNTHVGYHDDLGTFGAVDVTTIGFEPSLAFFATVNSSATIPAALGDSWLSFGAWVNDGVDSQHSLGVYNKDGSGSSFLTAHLRNDAALSSPNLLGAAQYTTVLDTPDASGFTLTSAGTPASIIPLYLCLKFANAPGVAIFDTTLPTAGNYTEVGANFQPDFGMLFSLGGVSGQNSGSASSNISLSVAAFDETTISALSSTSQDNAATTVEKSHTASALKIIDGDGATTAVEASSYTFDAGGWSFTLSTNPASALHGFGLAIGPTNVAAFDYQETATSVIIASTNATDYSITHGETVRLDNTVSGSATELYQPPWEGGVTSKLPVVTASPGIEGSVTGEIPEVSATAIETTPWEVAVVAPLPVVVGYPPPYGGVTSPRPTITGITSPSIVGQAVVAAILPTVAATVQPGVVSVGAVTANLPTIKVSAGLTAAIESPLPVIASEGIGGSVGTGSTRAKRAEVVGAGVQTAVWKATITAPLPSAVGTILSEGLLIGAAAKRKASVFGAGQNGQIGSGAVSSFLSEIDAVALLAGTAVGAITGQLPIVYSVGAGALASFIGWALNTESGQVSNYTNFPFIALGEFGGTPAGATADGIYLLEGADDQGAAIDALIKFGIADFNEGNLATARDAYVGGELAGDIELRVQQAGDVTEYAYPLLKRGEHTQGHHAILGKGFRSRYRQVSIANVAGNDFKINNLAIATRPDREE